VFKCIEVGLSYVCNNILTPMAPLLYTTLRRDLLLAARFLQVQQRLTKTPRLHHAQQIISVRLTLGAKIVMVVTCTFFRFVSFREPHRYSNLLRTQESPNIVNLTGPDTSHVIHGNLFRMSTFIESQKGNK
jgi:hypothetical protein